MAIIFCQICIIFGLDLTQITESQAKHRQGPHKTAFSAVSRLLSVRKWYRRMPSTIDSKSSNSAPVVSFSRFALRFSNICPATAPRRRTLTPRVRPFEPVTHSRASCPLGMGSARREMRAERLPNGVPPSDYRQAAYCFDSQPQLGYRKAEDRTSDSSGGMMCSPGPGMG